MGMTGGVWLICMAVHPYDSKGGKKERGRFVLFFFLINFFAKHLCDKLH